MQRAEKLAVRKRMQWKNGMETGFTGLFEKLKSESNQINTT